jgi:hypothetical protein
MDEFECVPIIKYDEFLKSKFISWECVAGRKLSHPQYDFGDSLISVGENYNRLIFSFRFYDNKIYIVFKFKPKQYKLNTNDSISFLFENEILLNFVINKKPYKSGSYYEDGKFPDFYEVLVPISIEELNIFSKYKFVNWSINLPSNKIIGGDKWVVGDDSRNHLQSKENFQIAINFFATSFLSVISNEIPEYNDDNVKYTEKEECYVYLMKDIVNNYHKIGISNKPDFREKTLQSEKPSIELIFSKRFPKRKIAQILEKTLHETYSNKRIRGEWFILDNNDVTDILILLK